MNFDELNLGFEEVNSKPSSAWLLSLIDLLSIILSFFVLMYSTKDLSKQKSDEIRNSFNNYLGGEETMIKNQSSLKIEDINILRKSENLSYVENMLISILRDSNDNNLYYSANSNEIVIWTEVDELPKNLSQAFNDRFFTIAKILNSINNQVEISSQGLNNKDADFIADFAIRKFKELGYINNMLITLPQRKIITENLEKDKNKIKIQIIIKDYESVF